MKFSIMRNGPGQAIICQTDPDAPCGFCGGTGKETNGATTQLASITGHPDNVTQEAELALKAVERLAALGFTFDKVMTDPGDGAGRGVKFEVHARAPETSADEIAERACVNCDGSGDDFGSFACSRCDGSGHEPGEEPENSEPGRRTLEKHNHDFAVKEIQKMARGMGFEMIAIDLRPIQ